MKFLMKFFAWVPGAGKWHKDALDTKAAFRDMYKQVSDAVRDAVRTAEKSSDLYGRQQ